jgi:hypothetical protein
MIPFAFVTLQFGLFVPELLVLVSCGILNFSIALHRKPPTVSQEVRNVPDLRLAASTI